MWINQRCDREVGWNCSSHGCGRLARDAGTIGYEVLTALGPRYHRVIRHGVNKILALLSAAVGRWGHHRSYFGFGKIALFRGRRAVHLAQPPFYGRLFLNALANWLL